MHPKSEILNPKHETKPNDQNSNDKNKEKRNWGIRELRDLEFSVSSQQ